MQHFPQTDNYSAFCLVLVIAIKSDAVGALCEPASVCVFT